MFTPLHAASASGQINVVRLLLDYGVEVDAVSCHGNTSLHTACLNGQDMVASELIAHGASIDTPNNKGHVINALYIWILDISFVATVEISNLREKFEVERDYFKI